MTFLNNYFKTLNIEALLFGISEKIISILLILILFVIFRKCLSYLISKTLTRSLSLAKYSPARQNTLMKLSHNLLDYSLYFLLAYCILAIIGLPVSSLLAGAGIAGVAIGLGAQGFLSDLVNGFFILFERQFDVGDSVTLTTISGVVASVGIRTTQIRDFDGTLHFIPNRHITIVSNLSRGDMRAQIDIPIYADTDLEQLTKVIEQVNEQQLTAFPEIVGVPTIWGARTNPNGQFIFRVDFFVQNGKQSHIYYTFYRLYQEALRANGISLPTSAILTSSAK